MPRVRVLLAPLVALALLGGAVPWWLARGARASGEISLAELIAGVLLAIAGAALALRAARLLGEAREEPPSPSRSSGRFIVRGPYRRIRHPLYAGIVLAVLGEAVALRSTALFVYAAALAIILHLLVVFVEEPRLRRRFEDLYDVYCERVPRWVPRRGRPNAP